MKDLLIKYNFNDLLDLEVLKETLHTKDKIILIKHFPLEETELQSFILKLGNPVLERRNNDSNSVFDVEVSRQNGFFRSFANSNLEFPLHTDCADFKAIPNGIALLCIKPALKNEGISTFAFLSSIINQLTVTEIEELLNKKWHFRNQKQPILTKVDEHYKICYDRVTMESFTTLNEDELNLLNKLDAIFKAHILSFELEKGDLILFRNDFLLHGRTAFNFNSDRLLKRVRFNL